MYTFKRPESLEIPQVYHTFKAKDKDSDNLVEYRVQDLPEEYFERAIDLMKYHYVPGEPFCQSLDLPSKPEAVDAYPGIWRQSLNEKLAVGCFKEGSDELVGVNCLIVLSEDDTKYDINKIGDPDVLYLLKAIEHTVSQFSVFENFNVDRYLYAYGLCINSSYRGRGIATEMLKARVPVLKALGLEVTSTLFSAIGSQTAAAKAGFEVSFEFSFAKLCKIFPKFDFSKSDTKNYKIMSMRI